jgi:serine/threonine protein kinase
MPHLQAGQELGAYRLVSRIGAGGFAEVWSAIESGPLGFEKMVALKILRAGTQVGERDFRSLVNEARLTGHLRHSHIVDFYGVAREAGLWFMAMELVDGRSLRDLLRELEALGLPLPRSVILDVGIQVARALHHAHTALDHEGNSLSVIHRDLKPANILVAKQGGVKIADFGIASAATNLQSLAGVKGTLAYMAPEYWAKTPDISPAVDLFALGAVLFELVTGRQLLDGVSTASIEEQALTGDPDEEVKLVRTSFPAIAPVIRALIERQPEERLQRASQVEASLLRIRERLAAPGDIEQFLRLLALAQMSRKDRRAAGGDLYVPRSDEPGWADLGRILWGASDTLSPDTQDWLPVVGSRPTHETWEFSDHSTGAVPPVPHASGHRRWLLGAALFLAGFAVGLTGTCV